MPTNVDTRDLFIKTERPDPELFYSRNDPNDPRMGDIVSHDPTGYDNAEIVILGCPQDEGVHRNLGRRGSAKAPRAIRQAFYKLSAPSEAGTHYLYDIGDTVIQPTLEDTHRVHAEIVERILADGKRLIVLGGGNDISYPDCLGLSRVASPVLAINVDSHFDVREDDRPTSGTPYRQLLDQGVLDPAMFFEVANKPEANSAEYLEYLQGKGVHVHPLTDVRAKGIDGLFRPILNDHTADAIFWGIDMDSVRTNDAPGVSASYPIGLTAEEIYEIATIAGGDLRTRLIEFSEVNPEYDVDHRTAKLVGMLMVAAIAATAGR
ncbi:arginase [candidate division GN15 bacterium]|nr:arginase [candidate division GN15 bacterium]